MKTSWITLYPDWYVQELQLLATHYPEMLVDEGWLRVGALRLFGNLTVRPPRGVIKHPICLDYPEGTPFEHPQVIPIETLPMWKEDGSFVSKPKVKSFDHRHQMPEGNLCLFQRETRDRDNLNVVQILRRAEKWFLGHHTNHWPPDSEQSELESHYAYATDALVPEPFFSNALDGHGRLLFAIDGRRYWEAQNPRKSFQHPELCPLILTSLTKETEIIQTLDARSELSFLYPWIDEFAWDPGKYAASPDLSRVGSGALDHGYWWALAKEPTPFHDGNGLLKVLESVSPKGDPWAMISEQLKGDLTVATKHIFGLRYPSREDGYEWLILFMPREPVKRERGGVLVQNEQMKRQRFENSPVWGIRVHRIKPTLLRLRNRGVVENSIETKTVALVGLGALGSTVAELLAKAGVGKFRLCDSDRLSTGNVARHIGGISDFGALKAHVVAKRLLEINPYLTFTEEDIFAASVVASLDRLISLMATADLTISTVADESVESVINQIAVMNHKPILYGRSLRRASMGRVFLVRSGQDACKACLAEYQKLSRNKEKVPEDWVDVTEDDNGVLLHECGRPIIAGSAMDLSFIASLIARKALDFLEGKLSDQNHWLWTQKPAGDVDRRLVSEMTTFGGFLPRRPDCPACQEPDVVELVMTDEVKQTIIDMTESSLEVETGGLLVGFVDDKKRAVTLRATGPGPKAKRTATLFRRDVDYVQMELERASSELGQKGSYIGEWHSHLSPEVDPSPTDIDSLLGISKAHNYLNRCPVLVIAGLDHQNRRLAALKSYVFPQSGRMYEIQNKTQSMRMGKE